MSAPIIWREITTAFAGLMTGGLYAVKDGIVRVGTPLGDEVGEHRSSGTAWKRVGVTFLVVSVMNTWVFTFVGTWIWIHNFKLLWWILEVLPPTLMSSGAFLYWRGRQYAAQASAERIITDAKPHLLYMRPFRSDSTFFRALRTSGGSGLGKTEEEQLADVLRPFGELVTIGRPGESLPTPGAARIYTSDEEWKDVIKRQMQTCRLAVIRAGVGENVLWELTQAVTSLDPQKLLILVRKMKAKDYEFFRTKASAILGVSLPERATLWRFARVSGFISFTADWRPTFLVLKAPYFRGGSFKSLAKYALRPIFENFGLEWQRPSISASTIFQVGLLFILGVIAIAAVAIIVLAYLRP